MQELLRKKIEDSYIPFGLIGLTEYSEEEYQELLEYALPIVRAGRCGIPQDEWRMIFAVLVEIAKRRDNNEDDSNDDSGLWDCIFHYLNSDNGSRRSLTDMIGDMCDKGIIPGVYSGHRYYATIQMHAFVPRQSIFSFFDLCFNVYANDLDYGFTSEDNGVCFAVAESLKSFLRNGYSENESVHIGSGVYDIKIGLRSFALCETLTQQFVEFISGVFEGINTLFSREHFLPETRIDHFLLEWWENKKNLDNCPQSGIYSDRLPITSKQNVTVKYLLRKGKAVLCIPPIRLENRDSTVSFQIITGSQKFTNNLRTKRGELLTTSCQYEEDLDKILQDEDLTNISIDVQISCDNELIFDSTQANKLSLRRYFILFSDEKEEIGTIKRTTNYFVYVRDVDSITIPNPDMAECVNGNLYSIHPRNGDELSSGAQSVLFVDTIPNSQNNKACLVGNYSSARWLLGEYQCDIYPRKLILLIPSIYNLRSLELRIDNRGYSMHSLSYVTDLESEFLLFDLTQLIEPYLPYEIVVHSYDRNRHLFNKRIILIPDFEIEFERPFYYGDDSCEIKLVYQDETHYLKGEQNARQIIFTHNDGDIHIDLPYFKWRINESNWSYSPLEQKVWYENLLNNGDRLEIDDSFIFSNYKVLLETDIGSEPYRLKLTSGHYEIGRAVCEMENFGTITAYVFIMKPELKLKLFEVATKEQFIKCPVEFENDMLIWNPKSSFIGRDNRQFFLIVKGNGVDIRQELGMQKVELAKDVADGVYPIRIKSDFKQDNMFAKREEKWTPLDEFTIRVGAPNQRFVLTWAHVKNGNVRLSKKYVLDQLVQVEEHTYRGRLCVDEDNLSPINKLPNSDGVQETINPVKITILPGRKLEIAAGWMDDIPEIGPLFCNLKYKEICNIERDNIDFSLIEYYQYQIEEE